MSIAERTDRMHTPHEGNGLFGPPGRGDSSGAARVPPPPPLPSVKVICLTRLGPADADQSSSGHFGGMLSTCHLQYEQQQQQQQQRGEGVEVRVGWRCALAAGPSPCCLVWAVTFVCYHIPNHAVATMVAVFRRCFFFNRPPERADLQRFRHTAFVRILYY